MKALYMLDIIWKKIKGNAFFSGWVPFSNETLVVEWMQKACNRKISRLKKTSGWQQQAVGFYYQWTLR